MGTMLGNILKWLAYAGAAGIMLLALLVGIVRLLLPLVPEYQDDIRRWTAEATGFNVEFGRIGASWPLAGPQIRFIDVTVTSRETGEPIIVADNVTAGISLFKLFRDRKVVLNRIGVEGSNIRIRHDAEKRFRIQERLFDEFFQSGPDAAPSMILPELLIELTAIDVLFTDDLRSADEYAFGIDQLDIRLSAEQIAIDGEVEMPTEFGGRASISTDLPVLLLRPEPAAADNVNPRSVKRQGQEWQIFFTGNELKIPEILEYAMQRDVPVRDANGSVAVAIALNDRAVQGIAGELDIADVVLRIGADQTERFEVLRGQLDWSRQGDEGWLLEAREISVEELGLFTPRSDLKVVMQSADDALSVRANAGFLRLQDLYPLVRVAENEGLLAGAVSGAAQLPDRMQGEVRNLSFSLQQDDAGPDVYSAALEFTGIGVSGLGNGMAIDGVSGTLVADHNGGSLQIDARAAEASLPALFMAPIGVQSLSGLMVWRVAEDTIQVVSDNIRVRTSALEGNTRFSLDWPLNDESPRLDLTATAVAQDAPGVVPLLPLKKFPATVAAWLDRAIIAGQVPQADIRVSGPLREFPFAGDEGVFHIEIDVQDGELDYADGWPGISDVDAQIIFDGLSLTSRRNSGRVGRIEFRDSEVRIADLRKGVLEVSGSQSVPISAAIDFLRRSPVAGEIGPIIDDVTGVGAIDAELSLAIPVTRPADYALEIAVEFERVRLGLAGLDWGLADIGGTLTVRNTQFHADGMTATLLGEPVKIDMYPAGEASDLYGQFVRVTGRTPAERWMQTLSVPFAERIAGPVDWKALVLIPRRQEEARPPVHIIVRTDLAGAESRMPAPLAKAAEESRALEIDVAFPEQGRLEVSGRLDPELSWAFDLSSAEPGWAIARGAVHAGSATAIVPSGDGVEISGRLDFLPVDDWLELAEGNRAVAGPGQADWQDTWREAVLYIDRLTAFGQQFTDVQFEALRDEQDWRIALDSTGVAGQIRVPLDLDSGQPIRLDMKRLWLTDADPDLPEDVEAADPRTVPAAEVEVGDFVIRDMRFGSLSLSIRNVAGGVQAEPIRTQAPAFTIEGDGAWLVHPNDDSLRQTRLALKLNGTDIKATLSALGYDPVIDGRSIAASGELTWLGGPTDDFLKRADGSFTISMKEGSVLAVDPGGGRILGVLSLASLPRRLSLDFSDVFDEGLGFDELRGDFTVDDGNAYTCNLGMEGSVADMGVVGRAGFGERDYDQLAVVRPHMSNLLAVGGVVVGGPVGGAAMLLFSQIFQKPLSTLGESYYSITGSWDDPVIRQIRGSDFDVAPLRNCEAYLSEAITESLKEE